MPVEHCLFRSAARSPAGLGGVFQDDALESADGLRIQRIDESDGEHELLQLAGRPGTEIGDGDSLLAEVLGEGRRVVRGRQFGTLLSHQPNRGRARGAHRIRTGSVAEPGPTRTDASTRNSVPRLSAMVNR